MLYQGLMQQGSVAQWRCATRPTSDLHRAKLHLHIARRYTAGALLVAAQSLCELARLTHGFRHLDDDQGAPQIGAHVGAHSLGRDYHCTFWLAGP